MRMHPVQLAAISWQIGEEEKQKIEMITNLVKEFKFYTNVEMFKKEEEMRMSDAEKQQAGIRVNSQFEWISKHSKEAGRLVLPPEEAQVYEAYMRKTYGEDAVKRYRGEVIEETLGDLGEMDVTGSIQETEQSSPFPDEG